jgi:hypothetical protein
VNWGFTRVLLKIRLSVVVSVPVHVLTLGGSRMSVRLASRLPAVPRERPASSDPGKGRGASTKGRSTPIDDVRSLSPPPLQTVRSSQQHEPQEQEQVRRQRVINLGRSWIFEGPSWS